MSDEKYTIYKTIDAPLRICGLTLDEAIPIIASMIGFGFVLRNMLLALMASAVVFVVMRLLKRGKSGGFLLNAIYWRLPGAVFSSYFRRTPKSSDRHFIG